MPSQKNYHNSKLEFLALKWSVTEHFKEYLAYAPFVVRTDNNPLTYILTTPNLNALKWSVTEHFKEYPTCAPFVVRTDNNPLTYILTTPNLDATGHRWVGVLASFEFTLEYQKGADNKAADALSHVPICHDQGMVQSLLEGAIMGAADRSKAEASEELLCEHVHLENEVCVQAEKLAPMHIVDWGEAQEADAVLATCGKWLHTCKDSPFPKKDALLKRYLGDNVDTEEGHILFHACHGLVLSKGLLYISMMPKGEAEGILDFVVPTHQCWAALNGFHHDVGHQGQKRTLVLTQEWFWWPMMADDCRALVWGCQRCRVFEGAYLKHQCVPSGHMHHWNSSTSTSPVWSQQWSSTSHLVSKMCL